MADSTITLACRNYDRTQAIIRGQLKLEELQLQVQEFSRVPDMFARMFRGEFDASEMSLAELVYYTSRDKNDFIGIPVFPLRTFRHRFIFCNSSSGIRKPEDLEGKTIAFPRWVQTACVWIRGILAEEYKISFRKTAGYVAGLHNWEDDERKEIKMRDGSVIRFLERRGESTDETVDRALREGEVDALGTAVYPNSFQKGDERVKRLFENYREIEAAYFRKTGIFPIMHVLAVRKSTVARYPDLPRQLFDLLSRAKKMGQNWIRGEGTLSMAWRDAYVEQERQFFDEDPWSYGLQKNIHVIDKFLFYCYEQGVSERKMRPEELFVSSTWDLNDE